MKHVRLVVVFFFVCSFARSQDSLKQVTQEVGFNTVSLFKQMFSNNPGGTLTQLPYDVFYNVYLQDEIGMRLGLGLLNQKTETSIEGQPVPRTSNSSNFNMRLGVSYNFVKHKRLTLNVFGDFIYEQVKVESVNTQTLQVFGSPVQSITVSSSDVIRGAGAQAGVGIKFNLYKHLSIYAEVPIFFISEKNTGTDITMTTGSPTKTSSSTVKTSITKIILPTTVYLVLRF